MFFSRTDLYTVNPAKSALGTTVITTAEVIARLMRFSFLASSSVCGGTLKSFVTKNAESAINSVFIKNR